MKKPRKKGSNPWVEHVRKYAKENNVSYGCAISEAKKTYKPKTKSKEKEEPFIDTMKKKKAFLEKAPHMKIFKD